MSPDDMIEAVRVNEHPKYIDELNPMEVNIVEVDYGLNPNLSAPDVNSPSRINSPSRGISRA